MIKTKRPWVTFLLRIRERLATGDAEPIATWKNDWISSSAGLGVAGQAAITNSLWSRNPVSPSGCIAFQRVNAAAVNASLAEQKAPRTYQCR